MYKNKFYVDIDVCIHSCCHGKYVLFLWTYIVKS